MRQHSLITMNSYSFSSNELMRSLLVVLYSICTIFSLVSSSLVERESMKRGVGQPHFNKFEKRGFDQDTPYTNTKNPVVESSTIATNSTDVSSTSTIAHENSNDITTKVSPGQEVVVGDITDHEKLNCSNEANRNNETLCPKSDNGYINSVLTEITNNKDMLFRTLYVTIGITGIVVVYFVARAIWLRQKRTKSRKYRIIAQNGDQKDLEMEPLGDGNDDDEDYTVFELNGRKK